MFELYTKIKDSLDNNLISRHKIKEQAKFEYDKRIAADSIKQAESYNTKIAIEKTKAVAEEKKKKTLMVGLVVLAVMLVLLFTRFKKTKKQKFFIEKQKVILENQHEELETIHKEVSDSIKYAQRLQNAILPTVKQFKDTLKSTFILFKPKDVVSGDFYWLHSTKDGVFFAAADCTGHGVPGAMVSVVCGDALNRSVKEFDLTCPSKILNKTRELVIERFSRSGEDVRDGMDIALCRLKDYNLTFSGANNPLWLITNKENASKTQLNSKSTIQFNDKILVEYKSDKQPIGLYEKMNDFTEVVMKVNPNDKVFIFSDGYADQFGGDKGKKMKTKLFKKILIENSHKDMLTIKSILDSKFDEWKGKYEQLDDVCVIGVEIV